MPTHQDLAQLARICLEQARTENNPEIAAELSRMALEYQERAAKLNGDDIASVGVEEAWSRDA